jgi:hypothetical protein
MKRALTAGAILAVMTTAPLAFAQQRKGDFGQQGEFIISADRLVPFIAFDNATQDDLPTLAGNPGLKSATVTQQSTSLSILYGGLADPGERFFTAPRAGFDYVVVPNVTVGGDLVAIFSLGGSNKTEVDTTNGMSTTTSTPRDTITGFGIAPRAGYILALNDMFSLWLRGGLSYYIATDKTPSNNNNTSNSTTINQFGLDLEPQFVLTPFNHVGFTAGLDVDIPLTGGISANDTTNGVSTTVSGHSAIFFLGVEVGMLVYF